MVDERDLVESDESKLWVFKLFSKMERVEKYLNVVSKLDENISYKNI